MPATNIAWQVIKPSPEHISFCEAYFSVQVGLFLSAKFEGKNF